MSQNYPNDADADSQALGRVSEHSDMTKPMYVDFFVAVPNESAGTAVAKEAAALGYDTSIELDEVGHEWTCYCSKSMILDYDSAIAAQDELDAIGKKYEGFIDGWGTEGNQGTV